MQFLQQAVHSTLSHCTLKGTTSSKSTKQDETTMVSGKNKKTVLMTKEHSLNCISHLRC